jgi:hypothetical protein
MPTPARRSCLRCRAPLTQPGRRGRPRLLYHSDACRASHRRFVTELNRGIERSRYSLREITALLAGFDYSVGASTISDWQTGRSMPSRASEGPVKALEWVVGIPAGHLVRELAGIEEAAARLQRQIARRLNAASDGDRLISTAVRDLCYIRSSLRRTDREIRQSVVAKREQVDRYWVMYRVDGGRPAEIMALRNCTRGEMLRGSCGVYAAELRFPKPLRPDLPYDFEYLMSYPHSDIEDFAVQRSVQAPLERLSVGIQFEPDAHPRRLCTSTWPRADAPPEKTAERCRPGQCMAFLNLSNPDPGIYGFSWR